MSDREIVQKGLDARKKVRAAKEQAEKFRADAAEVRDERFRDRMNYDTERRILAQRLADRSVALRRVTDERDKLIEQTRVTQTVQAIATLVKSAIALVLLVVARDLSLITPWLVYCLLAVTVTELACAIFKLSRVNTPRI